MKRYIPVFIFLFTTSCVYFNTFYNAKKYFNEAERNYQKTQRISPKERKAYQKVIEKCSKILEFYPDSKYVDDALYLMAISYLRIGDKAKAKRKFEELFTFYPNSEYVPRAKIEYARLLIESGNPEEARNMLKMASTKASVEEAALLLARSLALEDKCDRALQELKPLINKSKLPDNKKIEVYYLAAKCSFKTGEYSKAIEFLDKLQKFVLPDSVKVSSLELLGDIYLAMDSLDKALKVYKSIDLPPRDKRRAKIDYRIATIMLKKGETQSALKELKNVYNEDRAGKFGQLAAYTLAEEYEKLDSLNAAINWYKNASSIRANPEISAKARKKYKAYESIQKYSRDSTDVRLKLAEIYLLELNKPQKALSIYKSVVDSSLNDDQLKRALYGVIYIYSQVLKDPDSTQKYYNLLKERFRESLFVKRAESLIKSD